jgi:hypothetical protein
MEKQEGVQISPALAEQTQSDTSKSKSDQFDRVSELRQYLLPSDVALVLGLGPKELRRLLYATRASHLTFESIKARGLMPAGLNSPPLAAVG